MLVGKEFLSGEIQSLELEIEKAKVFLTQAQAVLNAYRMLLVRLEQPEPTLQGTANGSDLSSSS